MDELKRKETGREIERDKVRVEKREKGETANMSIAVRLRLHLHFPYLDKLI